MFTGILHFILAHSKTELSVKTLVGCVVYQLFLINSKLNYLNILIIYL